MAVCPLAFFFSSSLPNAAYLQITYGAVETRFVVGGGSIGRLLVDRPLTSARSVPVEMRRFDGSSGRRQDGRRPDRRDLRVGGPAGGCGGGGGQGRELVLVRRDDVSLLLLAATAAREPTL